MLSVQKQHIACTTLHERRPYSLSPAHRCSSRANRRRSTCSLSAADAGHVLHSGSAAGSATPLSGLDLQDSWSASGLASSITAAQIKPSLSIRPITTHVNVLLAGSGHYLGKAPYYREESCTGSTVTADRAAASNTTPSTTNKPKTSAKGAAEGPSKDAAATTAAAAAPDANTSNGSSPVDLHAAFLKDPAAWATQLPPVLLLEACREMVYKFQDSPGQGSTLDAHGHVETLLSHLLQQQAKDYTQLCGSRGMNKSLVCGCLQHSITACLYFLPPHGPSKVDLVAMAALSQHVALLPVLSLPEGASNEQTQQMQTTVKQILQGPGAYVEGLQPIKMHKLSNIGLQLPMVLRTPSPASPQPSVLTGLVQLLSTDEVYGLLDDAWERYSAFCGAYEAAGKDLTTTTTQLGRQFSQLLPSFAALPATTEIDAVSKKIDGLKEELASVHAAELLRHEKMFTCSELVAVVKAVARDHRYVAAVAQDHGYDEGSDNKSALGFVVDAARNSSVDGQLKIKLRNAYARFKKSVVQRQHRRENWPLISIVPDELGPN